MQLEGFTLEQTAKNKLVSGLEEVGEGVLGGGRRQMLHAAPPENTDERIKGMAK